MKRVAILVAAAGALAAVTFAPTVASAGHGGWGGHGWHGGHGWNGGWGHGWGWPGWGWRGWAGSRRRHRHRARLLRPSLLVELLWLGPCRQYYGWY